VPNLIADGQFVWGPNLGDFKVTAFLESIDSPFLPYGQEVEAAAAITSINPQILLTVLEMRYGYLSAGAQEEPAMVQERIERAAYDLAIPFYQHMYTWGARRFKRPYQAKAPPTIALGAGQQISVQTQVSSASYALAAALGKGQDLIQWQALLNPQNGGGFSQTFGRYFPQADLLDTSNSLEPDAPPPDDFFQLPFPLGAEWQFNGPHSWCGGDSCYQEPPDRSSMDFSTTWPKGEPYPAHYSVAASGGRGNVRTPYSGRPPCWVEVDHGGGWKTSYYHLRNVPAPGDQGPMVRNQRVGSIGEETCNGGFASGAHVHFTLWYNGAYYDLDGIKLSGWTVHSGPSPYNSGYLERDGLILEPYDRVRNDYHEYFGRGTDSALRFHGNQVPEVDQVKIQIDDPRNDLPGPPPDVGYHDFVIEFWLRADPGANAAPAIQCGANENWKQGNILFDRSVSNGAAEWGIALAGGKIAFGVRGAGGEALTLCSSTAVDDGEWHHVAVQRNRWDGSSTSEGEMWLFVDGLLQAHEIGPPGDISYPDDAAPGDACGPSRTDPCTEVDPYLVIGRGKWDDLHGFSGWLNDIRFSWWLRYFGDFTPSEQPHPADDQTVTLLRFNEGSGTVAYDTGGYDGGTGNGLIYFGGSPAGPEWVATSLFQNFRVYAPVISK
jgi:LasA protease